MLEKMFAILRSRKGLYLLPFGILSLFFVSWEWLLFGTWVYMVLARWQVLIYHEYQVHKYLKPKNKLIEIFGWFINAVWEWQSPFNKVRFHELHHAHYQDDENDPTGAKLRLAKSYILYCLDCTPHANIPYIETSPAVIETAPYLWFNKYWAHIATATLLLWVLFLPFWTFVAFYVFPLSIYNILYRATDWHCHKINGDDRNWTCLYLGTGAWHKRHHNETGYDPKTFFGPGIWRYLNVDLYLVHLFFDPIKKD